jgi:hypothetical protein
MRICSANAALRRTWSTAPLLRMWSSNASNLGIGRADAGDDDDRTDAWRKGID